MWNALSDGRATKTIDSFAEDLTTFISFYLSPTSFEDQREYLRSATKPFAMSCELLGSRLRMINNLSKWLPGSNATLLYQSDDMLKRAYFALVPTPWRIKFVETGNVLDGTYTMIALIRFMAVQESLSKRAGNMREANNNKRRVNPGRGAQRYGGRGRGSGGRYNHHNNNSGGYNSAYNGNRFIGGISYSNSPVVAAGYTSTPHSGYGANRTPTPRSSGGRFTRGGGRYTSPSGGRYSPPGGGYPPGRGRGNYALRPTYEQRAPGGRGPAPPLPNFHVEHYYANDEYQTEDQFYSMDGPPNYEDQFYQQEETYDNNDASASAQDHYHADVAPAETVPDNASNDAEDVHWLDEYEY
jgi:hypothetical protein